LRDAAEVSAAVLDAMAPAAILIGLALLVGDSAAVTPIP
jgi:hypothetical protein